MKPETHYYVADYHALFSTSFLVPIGLGLGGKYDTFSYCGAISILFALKFMAFWYTCSLEVQDREMPKPEKPVKTKSKPGKPSVSDLFKVFGRV